LFLFYFFFSSRRRHTRFSRDWSSDVCSSDLLDVEIHLVEEDVASGVRGELRPAWYRYIPDRSKERSERNRIDGHDAVNLAANVQIGRASCRERVEISVVAAAVREKTTRKRGV